ncbi:hypothetical protein ACOMHN_034773 [Nucella lapillus]
MPHSTGLQRGAGRRAVVTSPAVETTGATPPSGGGVVTSGSGRHGSATVSWGSPRRDVGRPTDGDGRATRGQVRVYSANRNAGFFRQPANHARRLLVRGVGKAVGKGTAIEMSAPAD